MNSSKIRIHGGIIRNSNNVKSFTSNISPDETGNIKTVSSYINGGAMYIPNCKNFEMNNLKITKCNSTHGGAIYFTNSTGKIKNSEFSYNKSGYGGGFFSSSNCILLLYNIKILNNSTEGGSGGGIYAYGELTIEGDKSNISKNVADTYGGGIMLKTKGTINNCVICNNKALRYCGGGIHVDGELTLNNAKIYKNWCSQKGGGINYEYKDAKFSYDKDKINTIVYDNKANQKGNDFYPELQ